MSINATNINTKTLFPYHNQNRISVINKIIDVPRMNVDRSLNKKLSFPNIPLPKSTSNNPEKKFVSIFKQREIEYDKNLRSIKSNLFEKKFKDVNMNNSTIKDNTNQGKRGNNFKFLNKKNVIEMKSNTNLNVNFNYENKNLKLIRERSRSATKKTKLIDQLKTTPGECMIENSAKSDINSERDPVSNIDAPCRASEIKMDLNTEKFEVNNNDKYHSELFRLNNDIVVCNTDENKDYFNFNLLDQDPEMDQDTDEGRFHTQNSIDKENKTEYNVIYEPNSFEEKKQKENKLIPSQTIDQRDSLEQIIQHTNENILDVNDKSLLELYMKDEFFLNGSELKTEDKTTYDLSKSKSNCNLMTKSIDELFNIERLFENTIPIHSIEFPQTTEREINLHQMKKIKSQTYEGGEFINYKIFQENVNKINLSKFSLSYENLKMNKEYKAKFTQEEYRLLLSAFLRFDYGKGILEEFHQNEETYPDVLSGHEISERMRVKMIDWMIEVLTNYKSEESTFFLAVNLMDRFFKLSKRTLKPDDLHLIGICCMFIASKFYDVYPIKLRTVVEKISHNKFHPEEIKTMEEEIVKALSYNFLKPTSWDFINFFLEEIFYFIENNFMIMDDTLSQYVKGMYLKGFNIKIDSVYIEKLKNTKKFNGTVMCLLRSVVVYLIKMNCHDYQLNYVKPSLNAASSLFVGVKICGQINREEYLNEYFIKKLVEVSKHSEIDIITNAQRILYNAQNFDKLFPNLENLKKVHFNHMLGYREKF